MEFQEAKLKQLTVWQSNINRALSIGNFGSQLPNLSEFGLHLPNIGVFISYLPKLFYANQINSQLKIKRKPIKIQI
jgi:hypothetical protein